MIIGIPKEIKNNENRVSLTPAGAYALVKEGHSVLVKKGQELEVDLVMKNIKMQEQLFVMLKKFLLKLI